MCRTGDITRHSRAPRATANVSTCTYVGTIGETGSSGQEPAAYIQVAPRNGNANGVYVETQNLGGAEPTNLPFHLIVAC